MKIQLKGREIPRTKDGDPAFTSLDIHTCEHCGAEAVERAERCPNCGEITKPDSHTAVLDVFSRQEVVALVNRALYQLEYQHTAHKERGKRVRAEEKAIRLKVKELFHVSWMKATPEQIERARREVEKA